MYNTVYLDLDDVVFDTEDYLRELLGGKWLGHKGLIYVEYENMTSEELSIVASAFTDYNNIPMFLDANEGIETLQGWGYKVILCTSYQSIFERIAKERLAYSLGVEIILCGESKSHVDMSGGIFVDNRGDHLDASNADVRVLYYKKGCSDSEKKDMVVYNWVELLEYLYIKSESCN